MKTFIKAAIRLMVIWLFLQTLIDFILNGDTIFAIYNSTTSVFFPLSIMLGSFLLAIFILVIIWLKTEWVVRILVGDQPDNELIISTSNVELIKVAMRILGIILLLYAIPTLIGLIGAHFTLTELTDFPKERANEIKNFIIVGVKIILGTWLMLGTRGITNTLDKVWDITHAVEKNQNKDA